MRPLNKFFYFIGHTVSRHPFLTISSALFICMIFSLGMINLKLQDDPQGLWVSQNSRGNLEQEYFNKHFGQFFRINQFILRTPDYIDDSKVDLFEKPYLDVIYRIQSKMENAYVTYNSQVFNISDVCYKPITGEGCLITSPMEFWLMNVTDLYADQDIKGTAQCIKSRYPQHNICFDRIGVPVMHSVVFGGSNYDPNNLTCVIPRIISKSLIVTLMFNKNDYTNPLAMKWEKDIFIGTLQEFNDIFKYDKINHTSTDDSDLVKEIRTIYLNNKGMLNLEVNFMAERSISDDLDLQNQQNMFVVIVSYSLMFIYISISIGYFPSKVNNRFLLGLGGITIVVLSVLSAIGVCSYLGIEMTLISSEVVPFLILAIGVDNMFLIMRSESDVDPKEKSIEKRVAIGLSNIGPSICTAATCEVLSFAVGTMTQIPALQSFCLMATIAVLIDFFLQCTLFISFVTLDNYRIAQKRADIIPCIIIDNAREKREEWMRGFFETKLTKFLLNHFTRFTVFGIALALTAMGILGYMNINLGINPEASVTMNSDIYNYFIAQARLVDAGPPAYLVFREIDYNDPNVTKNIFDLMDDLSSQKQYIQNPMYSWMKTFKMFLMENADWSKTCGSIGINTIPFKEQLQKFVQIAIESDCCFSYGICGEQYVKDIVFDEATGDVITTRFRFQHPPLRIQADFINDLESTRYLVDLYKNKITSTPSNINGVFAYSLFYVFFEQYYFVRGILAQNILFSIAAVIFATMLLTSFKASLFIASSVLMVSINLIGVCYLLDLIIPGYKIEFNAVFVVNIVMACGLAVEFCAHIMIAFLRSVGSNIGRARSALNSMGSAVLVGIGSTKFIGILVLSFAPSTIFRLYYFRMYLSIIILGLFYGLFILPNILIYIGPEHLNLGDDLKLKKNIEQEAAEKLLNNP